MSNNGPPISSPFQPDIAHIVVRVHPVLYAPDAPRITVTAVTLTDMHRPACLPAILMFASIVCVGSVSAKEYDTIIEKNLFHDQRKKWEMEKSRAKGSSSKSSATVQALV